jgi:rhodanese-related sulfurtransferase
VIGAATFISLTAEGDQAVQGFNFLIPVETVQEFARMTAFSPSHGSPFDKVWGEAVSAFFDGHYGRSVRALDAAERLVPGFPDVQRLRTAAQLKAGQEPAFSLRRFRFGFGLLAGVGVAFLALGARSVWRRRSAGVPGRVRRVAPDDLRRQLEAGETVTVLDARQPGHFAVSPEKVAGALRPPAEGGESPLRIEVAPDGNVVVYCDCPDEASSTRIALQLMQAGYSRVSVVRGGFPALLESGIAVEAKDVTPAGPPPARAGAA